MRSSYATREPVSRRREPQRPVLEIVLAVVTFVGILVVAYVGFGSALGTPPLKWVYVCLAAVDAGLVYLVVSLRRSLEEAIQTGARLADPRVRQLLVQLSDPEMVKLIESLPEMYGTLKNVESRLGDLETEPVGHHHPEDSV